jgi:hypothetical protein
MCNRQLSITYIMSIAGFIFYCIIFIYLLYRLTRNKVPLTVTELSAAFLFKVALGCVYGYIYGHYYGGDDTWMYHKWGLEAWQELLHHPAHYFYVLGPAEAFAWAGGGFWDGMHVYRQSLENESIIKPLSIANIFSHGNYYINVVFFNFILFWGHYWLFSLFVKEFPQKRKPLMLLIFFFPPLVFWLSGIRTDGLILFFLALLLVHFRRWLYDHKKWSVLYGVLAALGILIIRSQILFIIIPCLAAWYLSVKFNRKPVIAFLWVFITGTLLFFASAWISPHKNLPKMIAQRQLEFLGLQGTRFPLDTLQPSVTGFARVLPQAVSHTFIRPYIWEAKGMLQIMTAVEILVCWMLVLLAIIKKDIHWKQYLGKPPVMLCLFFGVILYIFIGYTIPFPGAIVRYKAIPELLLLTLPVICTKWGNRRTIPEHSQKINKKLYI